MNILVTGANGQLGNEMRIVAQGSIHHFFYTDVCNASPESVSMLHKLAGQNVCTETSMLDITDLAAIRNVVEQNQIQVIINCAAYTNVDAAEENQELAMKLNAKAPENLALAMKEVNGLLIHISTDYVFGKEPYNVPCREDQQGTPTGVYGQTKQCGEKAILAVGCQHVIIRTAWLYSEFGKNFCRTMLNLTASKPQLKVVFDQVGTPTYAYDLAKVISVILEDYNKEMPNVQCSMFNAQWEKNGIYHFRTRVSAAGMILPNRYKNMRDRQIVMYSLVIQMSFPVPLNGLHIVFWTRQRLSRPFLLSFLTGRKA